MERPRPFELVADADRFAKLNGHEETHRVSFMLRTTLPRSSVLFCTVAPVHRYCRHHTHLCNFLGMDDESLKRRDGVSSRFDRIHSLCGRILTDVPEGSTLLLADGDHYLETELNVRARLCHFSIPLPLTKPYCTKSWTLSTCSTRGSQTAACL